MKNIMAILSGIMIMAGSAMFMVFRSRHLKIDECWIDVYATNSTQNLRFEIALANSSKECTNCVISEIDDKVFIDVYGRYFTGYSKFNGTIDYTIPNGIKQIYLRGKNHNDLIKLWEKL